MFLVSEKLSDRVSNIGIIFVSFLAVLFVVLIGLAIYFYPDNYAFFSNYLSDLGMTKTSPHNLDNSTSSMLFTLAMVTAGLLSMFFWTLSQNVIRFHVGLSTIPKLLIILSSILGFVSSFFGAAIGFYHYDTDKSMHLTVGWFFFILASIACIIYSILFIYLFMSDTQRQTTYTIISLIITLAIATILYLLIKDQITSLIISAVIWLIVFIMFVEPFLSFKFEIIISYFSFFISFALLVAILIIVSLYLTIGLQPVMEVSFIVVISAFLMTNNLELFKIERKS